MSATPQKQPTSGGRDLVTHLTPANTSSGSVRTTIPNAVLKAIGAGPDDTIRWEISGSSVSVKKQTDA